MKIAGKLLLILVICTVPESKKFGPFDVVFVLDESASMLYLNTTNTPNGGDKHYKKALDILVENFDIGKGDNQSRVAVYCTSGGLMFTLEDRFDENEFKSLTCRVNISKCLDGYCEENFHEFFKWVSDLLQSDGRDAEKIVIVFTDGILYPDETKFPEEAEIIRKDGKFFFFHLIEPQQLTPDNKTAMISLTQNEEHVIYFDVQDVSKVKNQFLKAICKSDKNAKCEVVPEDPFNKCRKLSGFGYEACMENQILDCIESACGCDLLYPWINSSCSVTCGKGQQTLNRKVPSDSLCPKEDSKTCFIYALCTEPPPTTRGITTEISTTIVGSTTKVSSPVKVPDTITGISGTTIIGSTTKVSSPVMVVGTKTDVSGTTSTSGITSGTVVADSSITSNLQSPQTTTVITDSSPTPVNSTRKRTRPLVRTVSILRRSSMVSVRVSPSKNLQSFIISVFITKLLFY